MKLWLIVPAAGTGKRFGAGLPKQYQDLAGRPVLVHTLERLLSLPFDGVVVALNGADRHWPQLSIASHPLIHTVIGGAERVDSVRAALAFLADRADAGDWVLVHDVARPCITAGDVQKLIATLEADAVGGLLAAPVSDTLKRVDGNQQITGTEDRSKLWAAMTPQMFRYGLLCQALDIMAETGQAVTDEASAVEAAGFSPRVVMGRRDNIKITQGEDMVIAEAIIAFQQQEKY